MADSPFLYKSQIIASSDSSLSLQLINTSIEILNNKNDTIYQQQLSSINAFSFDERVASVFADMISRSVPGYSQILSLLPTLTKCFQFHDHNYYDLGCSLGAGMLAMADGLRDTKCTIHGIDNSPAMLKKAQPLLDSYQASQLTNNYQPAFQLDEGDINTITLESAAMVLMNFTLQFIAINQRDDLIDKIYTSLSQGGALILSEKIKFSDPATNMALIDIHHQYKSDQGYSQLEISQKRDSIENVLIPETLETHITRLKKAGFTIITPWIQNLQFVSILAIK